MRYLLVAIACPLLLLVPSAARADHPPILLEAYTGAKPPDARPILGPVLGELAAKQFVAGPEALGRRFETTVSRPALNGGLPKDFSASVDAGYTLWTSGKFEEAAALLAPLVDAARENSGAFAGDQELPKQLQRALVALSLSYLKLGDTDAARSTLREALRGDPELKLPRGTYGQEAATLFADVLADLKATGTGKVRIEVAAEAAGIYVNERLVGLNRVELYLLRGEYRVVAQIGSELTRVHRVVVAGGDIHALEIDPELDRAIYTGPEWTGLRYGTRAERERLEATHAAAVARALGADQVAVIGVDFVRGRRAVVGAMINKRTGRDIRRGTIPFEGPPAPEQLRNLARFLDGAPPAPGIEIPAAQPEGPLGPAPWGGWKFVTGGAALAAGIAGGVLLAYDGECSTDVDVGVPCPDNYETAVQGWVAIGAGAALVGATVYFVMRERRDRERRAQLTHVVPAVVPAPGGAIAGFAARF